MTTKARASEVSVVLVTAPDAKVAARIANTLVEEKLIACANIVPGLRSIYEWKGERCDEAEVLMLLKAPTAGFERLRRRIVALHPAEVPEVLQLGVSAGHAPYLAWVLGRSA